jgi:hypothetical protein
MRVECRGKRTDWRTFRSPARKQFTSTTGMHVTRQMLGNSRVNFHNVNRAASSSFIFTPFSIDFAFPQRDRIVNFSKIKNFTCDHSSLIILVTKEFKLKDVLRKKRIDITSLSFLQRDLNITSTSMLHASSNFRTGFEKARNGDYVNDRP